MDRTGKYLFAADIGAGKLLGYSIDQNSGALAAVPGSPFEAGIFPVGIVADPSADFVLFASEGDDDVSAYAINTDTGALTPVSRSPFQTDRSLQMLQ